VRSSVTEGQLCVVLEAPFFLVSSPSFSLCVSNSACFFDSSFFFKDLLSAWLPVKIVERSGPRGGYDGEKPRTEFIVEFFEGVILEEGVLRSVKELQFFI
jgi:hypothetical protein